MAAAPSSASAASAKRASYESMSSVSTTSLIFDRIGERAAAEKEAGKLRGGGRSNVSYNDDREERGNAIKDEEDDGDERDDYDLETGPFLGGGRGGAGGEGNRTDGRGEGREGGSRGTASAGLVGSGSGSDGYKKMDRSFRKIVMGVTLAVVMAWVLGLFVYVSNRSYRHGSEQEHDPLATATRGSLRPITRAQIDAGLWAPRRATIHWIEGPGGEDGQLVETAGAGKDYLVIEDVRAMGGGTGGATAAQKSRTLVKTATFSYGGQTYSIDSAVPCRDMSKVLLGVDTESNWRHSSTAAYFVLDVASQTVQALIPGDAGARVQLALWSPTNDAVAFTRDNNLFLRGMAASEDAVAVRKVTADGGADLFYGVPDWVYEEEVFSGSSATWWAPSGQHVAFLRTNETGVPSYPVQYFMERPSGSAPPAAGEENYPEVQQIKYPKAGAHNPVVELLFCDTALGQVFEVEWPGAAAGTAGFADNDRLITTVLWLGPQKVLVKETNRVSNVMRVVVVDVAARKATVVRTVDVGKLDGGWFEISQRTRFVPADAARQRPHDGYIDTVIYNDGDHLAYFSPPENPEPVMLTRGPNWEVVDAPAAVDLQRNLVYFLGTKDGSTQRHLYSVTLTGGGAGEATAVTNTSAPGFYSASFSTGAGFVLLEYRGPGIPWQKVVSTPASASSASSSSFEHVLADNAELAERARKHALPLLVYGTIEVDGVKLNYVERRPPHFDGSGRTQYPVLFQQYSGPGSQEVRHEFRVDFQAYVAARLGYVVVTVDPRGTGFRGRAHRVVVRGRLGLAESHDHIGAARNWAARPYVDAARLAIWGWSYGGFTTLKTLEQDAGRTFRYGMAVAPVTDWRFYDSVYTERYMDTPQANAAGYDASAVRNASALGQNVRFLLMHGVADDNVHMQNSLALIDRLDLAGVSNYDVHVFPDSDHGIYFHNAHQIVYDKLENWLINAFNGEWLKVDHAKPTGKR